MIKKMKKIKAIVLILALLAGIVAAQAQEVSPVDFMRYRLGSAVAVEFRQCVFRLVRSSWIAVAHGSHGELVFVGVSRRKVALGTYRNGLAVVVMCVGEGYVPFSCVRFGRGSQVLFSR